LIVAFVAAMLGGCSSSRPDRVGDEYFDPVRVARVERETEGSVVPEFTAPSSTKEGMEPLLRQMMREQSRRVTELEKRLAAVETRQAVAEAETGRRADLTPGEEALLAMIREQNLRLEEIIEQVRLMSERGKAAPLASTAPIAQRPPRERSRDRSLYAAAIGAYQQRKYRDAEAMFSRALQGPIETSLADNCRFWLGVSRFQQRDLVGARLALEPVSRDVSSDKRIAAILMLGQVFEGMGRRDLARNAYERIVREHPQSSLRSVAERKLATVKLMN
jgi:TolA-binding protein